MDRTALRRCAYRDTYADGTTISPRRSQKAEILAETIARCWPERAGLEVVDFGCADGAVPVLMLGMPAGAVISRVTGITLLNYNDLPEKPAHPHPRFRRLIADLEGDLAGLDLPWGACDVVTATAFFHYLHNPLVAFRHAARLLRPHGVLLAGMPSRVVLGLRRSGLGGLWPRNNYIRQIHGLGAWAEMAAACGLHEVSRQAVQWAGTARGEGLERWMRHHRVLPWLGSNYLVVYRKPCA